MYDTLTLPHTLFRITCLGFECKSLFNIQKGVLRIMPNINCNAHIKPIFKDLILLKLDLIFDIQCMYFLTNLQTTQCWSIFILYQIQRRDLRNRDQKTHPVGTFSYPYSNARIVLRHHDPKLIDTYPHYVINRIRSHSIHACCHLKLYIIIKILFILMHSGRFCNN